MRKIWIILSILIINIPVIYAYELTNNDNKVVEIIWEKIEEKSDNFQNNFADTLEILMNNNNYSNRINAILNEIVENIQNNLSENNDKSERDFISKNINENKLSTDSHNGLRINLEQVKNNWLTWNNKVRDDLWLTNYSYNTQLEKSATTWSNQAKEKWEISHKRNETDGFYDYNSINKWFWDNEIVCKNIDSITHTENIWWWGYTCTDWECSDELSTAIKRAFDAYMDEKWTQSDAHYRSLTQQYFKSIWLWISIDDKWDNYYEYYLTIHYCTNLVK